MFGLTLLFLGYTFATNLVAVWSDMWLYSRCRRLWPSWSCAYRYPKAVSSYTESLIFEPIHAWSNGWFVTFWWPLLQATLINLMARLLETLLETKPPSMSIPSTDPVPEQYRIPEYD